MSPGYGAPQSPSWWQRNWKWVVPVGCLGMLMALVAFVGIILVIVFGAINSSEPVAYASRIAKQDPRVLSVLGQPVETGWFVSGSVNSNGPTGSADIALPVSGPKGSATLYVEARKTGGTWQYHVLQLEVDGRFGRINLLEASNATPREPTQVAPAPAEPTPAPPPEPAAGGTYNTP